MYWTYCINYFLWFYFIETKCNILTNKFKKRVHKVENYRNYCVKFGLLCFIENTSSHKLFLNNQKQHPIFFLFKIRLLILWQRITDMVRGIYYTARYLLVYYFYNRYLIKNQLNVTRINTKCKLKSALYKYFHKKFHHKTFNRVHENDK